MLLNGAVDKGSDRIHPKASHFFSVKQILKLTKTQYPTYRVSKPKSFFITPMWLFTGMVKNLLQIIHIHRFISRLEYFWFFRPFHLKDIPFSRKHH
jgi:hypothetical protein